MFGLEWEVIAFMSAALIVGGIVKGVVALGLPIVTMAFTLNFMEPLTVLGMLVMPILVTNLWQTVRAGNVLQPLGRFWPMIVMALIFLFIGAELVVAIDTAVLFGMLGCFVVLFSATNLMKPRVHPLRPETEKWAGPLAGAFGGFLGGISTIWGPPMMMYFVMLKLEKDYFVRTVGLAWFSLAVPLTIAYWRNGVFSGDIIPLSFYACVPGMIGIFIGEKIRDKIDQKTFRKVMLVVLFIIGLNLIRRAVF
jgi:uncharacterized membrane protein YfcA